MSFASIILGKKHYIKLKCDTSIYWVERPLLIGTIKNLWFEWWDYERIQRDKLSMYSYIPDDEKVEKMAKGTKKYIIKNKLNFNDYRIALQCLMASKIENEICFLD